MSSFSHTSPEKFAEIVESNARFNEDGYIMIMWGWLVIIAALGQIVFLKLGMYHICWFPWLLMPLGFIYTFWYFSNKKNKMNMPTHFSVIIKWMGIAFALNLMFLGFLGVPFVFYDIYMGIALLLISFFTLVVGLIFKFNPSIIGGIVCNLLSYFSFGISKFINEDKWVWLLGIMILALIFTNLIPGYILKHRDF